MAPDAIAEQALLEISRLQRETLERWARVSAMAGEYAAAEEFCAEISRRDEAENMKVAA